MTISNASQLPKRLYGLHMCEGVAEYKDSISAEPYRILIGEECLKEMDQSFEGKPVYVKHVEEVNLDKLSEEMAGVVVRSFYNPPDGKHWIEFIITSDSGHKAINAGWRLSNAYVPKEFSGGGKWHNVEYLKEVKHGEYEHLAIVPNPRYEESIVLTPEEFKTYNQEKELELKKLANSKGEPSMLKIFKRTKVENAVDYETILVALKSGTEKTIAQLVNDAEMAEEHKKNEEKEKAEGKVPMANGEHHVEVGGEKMSVNQLVEKYNDLLAMKKEDAKDPEEDKEAMKKAKELEEHEKKELAEKKEHDASDVEEKKEHAGEEVEEKKKDDDDEMKKNKKKNAQHFEDLKNAPFTSAAATFELSQDKVARGKARYGSN